MRDVKDGKNEEHGTGPASDGEPESSSASGAASTDTEGEIGQTTTTKSRKTLKRKRRATSPSRFGAALETLLETKGPAGVAAPLSLKPGAVRRHKEEKLERGARKVLDGERREREEKARIRDVIGGGWGVDSERALRKVAQRGVVTLFNAIQQSQALAEEMRGATRAVKGTGKATLPAPAPDRNDRPTAGKKAKINAIGKGKDVDETSFLDMIRAGGVVSKT